MERPFSAWPSGRALSRSNKELLARLEQRAATPETELRRVEQHNLSLIKDVVVLKSSWQSAALPRVSRQHRC